MYGLDLFSGIGGLTLALQEWIKPIAYCELEPYARGVLLSRMAEGKLPQAPIWDDVRSLGVGDLPVRPDIIYGGFPCQDISVAGRGKGLEGERSGLFFQIVRLIGEIKPRFVFLENVPAIRTRGGATVGKELARLGFDCRWDVVSAAEVGAPHLRKRWFLLAHAKSDGREQRGTGTELSRETGWSTGNGRLVADSERAERGEKPEARDVADGHNTGRKEATSGLGERCEVVGDAISHGLEGSGQRDTARESFPAAWPPGPSDSRTWAKIIADCPEVKPVIRGMAHGIPKRVDRLRTMGNAVVPLQARTAFKRLAGL